MESDKITIVAVNHGGGNDGTNKIASDILYDSFRLTFIGFGIDVEAVFMLPVTAGFYFFKGWANPEFRLTRQGGTEGIAEKGIVKMINITPETVITVAALGNEAVNVGIPFQVPAKDVKYHDKARSKIHGFILFEKHA